MVLFKKPLFDNKLYLTLYFVSAMMLMFLMSAQIFGYSSLLVIFKEKHFFGYLCENSSKWHANVTRHQLPNISSPRLTLLMQGTQENTCLPQLERLNLLYVVGVLMFNFGKLPAGNLIDIIGPKVCCFIGRYA